jgi:hypothetical protein
MGVHVQLSLRRAEGKEVELTLCVGLHDFDIRCRSGWILLFLVVLRDMKSTGLQYRNRRSKTTGQADIYNEAFSTQESGYSQPSYY